MFQEVEVLLKFEGTLYIHETHFLPFVFHNERSTSCHLYFIMKEDPLLHCYSLFERKCSRHDKNSKII